MTTALDPAAPTRSLVDHDDPAERTTFGVALVTGASGTIGASIAQALSRRGLSVAVHYRSNLDGAMATAADCPGPTHVVGADLSIWSEVDSMCESVRSELGSIDVLVNCAGMRRDNFLAMQPIEEWRSVVDVNLLGTFHVCRAVTQTMIRRRRGSIINIVSPLARTGNVGQSAYAAAKAGIVALTSSLAAECATRNVQVNAISPGFVDSAIVADLTADQKNHILDRTILGRPVDPDDVGRAVEFILDSRSVNGAIIPVDGGFLS